MRRRLISSIIGMFLMVACCFVSPRARAHTPTAREIQAIVQAIDYEKKIMTLTYVQERGPEKLVWKADTQFLCDAKQVPATALLAGRHVTVYYHSPFFGKPYVTKAVWGSGD